MNELRDVYPTTYAIQKAAEIVHAAYGEIPDQLERREAMYDEIGRAAAMIAGPVLNAAGEAEGAAFSFVNEDED